MSLAPLEWARLGLCGVAALGFCATDLMHFAGRGRLLAGLGPISNRLLLPLLVVVLGLLLLSGVLAPEVGGQALAGPSDWPWYLLLPLHLALAAAVGFGLWAAGFWAGGDGKLFAILALAFPPGLLHQAPPLYFTGWVLLVNAFLVFAVLLPLELLWGLARRLPAGSTRKPKPSWPGARAALSWLSTTLQPLLLPFLTFLLAFLALRLARSLARQELQGHFQLGGEALFLVLFFGFSLVKALLNRPLARPLLPLLLGLAALALWYLGQLRPLDLLWSAAFSLALVLLRLAYDAWLDRADVVDLPWAELRPGLIPSPACLVQFRLRERFFQAFLTDLAPDGLNQTQVKALQDWYARNEPQGTFQISRTLPFAPALLAAIVLTALFGAPLLRF
jgi:hypothetical protein